MAVTVLTQDLDNTVSNGGTRQTASISPAPNALIVVFIASDGNNNPPTLSGNNLNYVKDPDPDSSVVLPGSKHRITIYRAMGANPMSGPITIQMQGHEQQTIWAVIQITDVNTSGADGAGAVAQIKSATGSSVTSLLTSLDAFGSSGNTTIGGFVLSQNVGVTPGAGFTELTDNGSVLTLGRRLFTEFKASEDTSVDATWGSSANVAGIALEVRVAGAGPSGGADTQDERRSVLGVPAAIRILPVPASGISAGDRLHVWLYRGIIPVDVSTDENVRRSILGLYTVYRVLPKPGGGITAQDRYHLWIYRKHPIAPPVRPSGIVVAVLFGSPQVVQEAFGIQTADFVRALHDIDRARPWLVLFQLPDVTLADGTVGLYLVNHPRSGVRSLGLPAGVPAAFVYGGKVHRPYPVRLEVIESDAQGQAPKVQAHVSNATREVQALLELNDGLRGKKVSVLVVNAEDFASGDRRQTFVVDSVIAGEEVATFTLSYPIPAFGVKFPGRIVTRAEFPLIPGV